MRGLRAASLSLAFVLSFIAFAQPASSHASLEVTEAAPNSSYKAVIRIGHGCEGAATTTLRVRIPEGAIVAKPMPKPGWELTLTTGPYATTYDYYGTPISEGVTEIAWTGGTLPDAWYDEFVFRVRLTDFAPGSVVYFPVVQECESGVHRWIEIPEAGKTADDYAEPAPGVTILEPAAE